MTRTQALIPVLFAAILALFLFFAYRLRQEKQRTAGCVVVKDLLWESLSERRTLRGN